MVKARRKQLERKVNQINYHQKNLIILESQNDNVDSAEVIKNTNYIMKKAAKK